MAVQLAVAALSARMLTEAARDGGYRPIALDVFGDADTRRAAEAWYPIGHSGELAIDGEALLGNLRQLRRQGAVGWIAGSGFEAQPALLAAAAQLLPLLGNPPAVVARVRDPRAFFACLTALGIPHPPTRSDCPPSPHGWLRKNAASSGGWEVWPAALAATDGRAPAAGSVRLDPPAPVPTPVQIAAPTAERHDAIYYQRVATGTPMSALFLADGRRCRLLGVNRQIVRRLGDRPYAFHGCIGPLPVTPGVRRALQEALDALTANFGLCGLNGLDFLLDDERIAVLELNPRPPASMTLYRDALPGGLLRAHLAASLDGRLPAAKASWPVPAAPDTKAATDPADVTGPTAPPAADCQPPDRQGFEVFFTRRAYRVSAAAAAALAARAWCHDLPAEGTPLGSGEPLCTVSASARTTAAVRAQLGRRRRQISTLLEQIDEASSGVFGDRTLECQ